MREAIVEQIWQMADRVARSHDIEIVEIELLGGGKHRTLRVYIDKDGGVSLANCETISHELGEALDAADVIPGTYTLEVSSPGVERKLSKPRDFVRFQGQRVKLVLREPMEKASYVDGILQAFEDNVLTLENKKGERIRVPFDNVKKANLKFEW